MRVNKSETVGIERDDEPCFCPCREGIVRCGILGKHLRLQSVLARWVSIPCVSHKLGERRGW